MDYFITELGDKALCLLCTNTTAFLKEYDICQHYQLKRSSKYSQPGGNQWFKNLENVRQNCPVTAEFTQNVKTKTAVAKVKFSNGTFVRQAKKAV